MSILIQPKHGLKRYRLDHLTGFIGNLKALAINRFVGDYFFSEYFARGFSRVRDGMLQRGEFNTFGINLVNISIADMKIEPGHGR